ncbi:MAG: hypothetical protein E7048_08405 [Lentisphaerae bacterium]|nr:hypothetical protein [Lentisphaerota bacterium]MBR2871958.1 hypothetical protein [Lentisphaeria bacterium]
MYPLSESPGPLQDLSGIWQFAYRPGTLEDLSISSLEYDSYAPVPGCWDLLPDCRMKRGTGIYRRKVYAGGMTELCCEALGLRGEFYWDGVRIGISDTPFTSERIRFNAGSCGEHELVIAVNNVFDTVPGSPFKPNYDFYAHGGIYRKVTIAPAEEFYPEYIKVLPLDPEKGRVEVRLSFLGSTTALSSGEIFFDNSTTGLPIELKEGKGSGHFTVPFPRVWSPETPELHKLTLKLNGHHFTTRFGLRTIETQAGKIFLNGQELKVAGINRHDCHPDFGYAIPDAIRLSDLLMLKQQGFNCIRGCHYPQSEDFLTMCDTMGFLVWEESLAWGNKEEDLADPLFRKMQLRQTEKMVHKSFNHPSVIMWGFLNECHSNTAAGRELISDLAAMLHAQDPTRPVTFGTKFGKKDICLDLVDIISFNTYPCWYGGSDEQFLDKEYLHSHLQELAEFASSPQYRDKPLIISEIGAEGLPGDHSGMRWSEDYQSELLCEALRHCLTSERFCGTFLWQFCDTRTYISNSCQARTGGFNHKGIVDGSRNKKLAFNAAGQTIRACLSGKGR